MLHSSLPVIRLPCFGEGHFALIATIRDVTHILGSIEQGDSRAAEELLALVYEELRKLAASKLAREKGAQTLQATALVHEAWLRLAGSKAQHWKDRSHFFGAAPEAMRPILIDNARRKAALKRGGKDDSDELHESQIEFPTPPEQVLAFNDERCCHPDGEFCQQAVFHG